MIVYSDENYTVKKFYFGWYRVYEYGVLHSKFKYQASALNFINMKHDQDLYERGYERSK